MIDRRATGLRLLWWQERAQLLPVGVGEDGQARHRDGSGQPLLAPMEPDAHGAAHESAEFGAWC